VGLHTLWNGGFEPLVYLTGLDYFAGSGSSLSLYGETLSTLLVGYLILLSLGLWLLLRRIVNQISLRATPDLTPATVSRRAIATWAIASALVIVPIGATLSPAWNAIRSLIVRGEIRQVETPTLGNLAETETAYKNKISDLRNLSRLHPDLSGVNRPGDVYQYAITLEQSRPALWSYNWCATARNTLDENFQNMKLEFFIDEAAIPIDKFLISDFRSSNKLYCRQYYAVVSTWPPGRFNLETRVTFLRAINDGIDEYPAGTHYFRYAVTVKQ
jgi:hypothetical protein